MSGDRRTDARRTHPVKNAFFGAKLEPQAAEVANTIGVSEVASNRREPCRHRRALSNLLEDVRHGVLGANISSDLREGNQNRRRTLDS
jgi:hypothetical protein